MKFRNLASCVLAAVMLTSGAIVSTAAQGSVVIAGTRVIYQAADSEETLKLSNEGKAPALVQVWLDEGDPKTDPSKLDLPFVLTPPFARIDPDKSQTIRIAYTGEPMPQDRETLLWFNVLEIPPKPSAAHADANYVQLAFRSRLKFFFRPPGLQGKADEAPDKLVWHLNKAGGKSSLLVSNPTPYHVTIIEAQVGDGPNAPKFEKGDMVAPGAKLELPLSATPGSGGKVDFRTLNDYGGPVKHEAALQ